jgi:hypothetical protein
MFSGLVRVSSILVLVLISGCASNYKLVRVERTGPVLTEIWKRNNQCEARTYLDVYYYKIVVPC